MPETCSILRLYLQPTILLQFGSNRKDRPKRERERARERAITQAPRYNADFRTTSSLQENKNMTQHNTKTDLATPATPSQCSQCVQAAPQHHHSQQPSTRENQKLPDSLSMQKLKMLHNKSVTISSPKSDPSLQVRQPNKLHRTRTCPIGSLLFESKRRRRWLFRFSRWRLYHTHQSHPKYIHAGRASAHKQKNAHYHNKI